MGGSEGLVAQSTGPVVTKKLASTDKKTRDKGVYLFVLWLSSQKEVDEHVLKKIWKGLFYCVWHSDKALVQADLIETLAGLLEKVDVEVGITFFKVFLSTLRREWGGIDKLRLDKFYLLLRRFLFHMFKVLNSLKWEPTLTVKFMDALEERVYLATDRYPALGMNLHLTDVYLEEFSKFLPAPREVLGLLLKPFISLLSGNSDRTLIKRVRERVFDRLIEDGRTLPEVVKNAAPDSKDQTLGYLLYCTPVASTLFDIAAAASTPQANRRVLYELHEEFSKVSNILGGIDGTIYDRYFDILAKESLGSELEANVALSVDIMDGGPISSGRLKRKQVKAQKLGVTKTVSMKLQKRGDSKKLRSKKNSAAEASIADMDAQHVVELPVPLELNGGIGDDELRTVEVLVPSGPTGAEGVSIGGEKQMTDELECNGNEVPQNATTVVTVGTSLPLLRKRLVKDRRKIRHLNLENDELGEHVGEPPAVQLPPVSVVVKENGCGGTEINMKFDERIDCFVTAQEVTSELDISLRAKVKRKSGNDSVEIAPESLQVTNLVAVSPQNPVMTEDDKQDSARKVKKVRFALTKNVVWKPQGPIPPLSVRTPPSATPRGSAMKVGVPPGPIRTRPLRAACLKSRKRVAIYSQKVAKAPSRKVKRRKV